MGCSPPNSSAHGILQARVLGWEALMGDASLRKRLLNCRGSLSKNLAGRRADAKVLRQEGGQRSWSEAGGNRHSGEIPNFQTLFGQGSPGTLGLGVGMGDGVVSHPSPTHSFFPCLGQNPERDMFSFLSFFFFFLTCSAFRGQVRQHWCATTLQGSSPSVLSKF